jgi:hypothetical protein
MYARHAYGFDLVFFPLTENGGGNLSETSLGKFYQRGAMAICFLLPSIEKE